MPTGIGPAAQQGNLEMPARLVLFVRAGIDAGTRFAPV